MAIAVSADHDRPAFADVAAAELDHVYRYLLHLSLIHI